MIKVASTPPYFDYLIAGGGIVGLTLARELVARKPTARIVVLEKETTVGAHASGRNSGVVHAGIYYAPGSLKAKLCVEGAELLVGYCKAHRLPLDHCGKLIVPYGADEEERLAGLMQREIGRAHV